MVKKLARHGNSYALVIDRAVMELLRIGPDTPLQITTNGDALVVAPVRDGRREAAFQKALQEANRKHAKALRKLAE